MVRSLQMLYPQDVLSVAQRFSSPESSLSLLSGFTLLDPLGEGLRVAHVQSLVDLRASVVEVTRAPFDQALQLKALVEPHLRMVYCPARTFTMGTNVHGGGAGPAHAVRLSYPYWMGQTPVTQFLYHLVTGESPSASLGPRKPVETVSWLDAVRFCNRLSEVMMCAPVYRIEGVSGCEVVHVDFTQSGYRLPTEAEWESSARASNELFLFSGGDELDVLGWSSETCGQSQDVGKKRPNGWHLYDMSGNVFEWCCDVFQSGLYSGRSHSVTLDPCVLSASVSGADSKHRVIRGGSYYNPDFMSHVCYRGHISEHVKSPSVGFRVVRRVQSLA